MPTKEAKARRASQAMALANSEQRKRLADAAALAEASKPKKHIDENPDVQFVLAEPIHTKDWDAIIADYKKEKYACNLDEKTGALIFPTKEKAIEFFDKQAKPPNKREFLATEYVNGAAVDFHLFSCGDEKLYQGTFAEIKAQLIQAIKEQPENAKAVAGLKKITDLMPTINAASEMRAQLKVDRQTSAEPEQEAAPARPTPASIKR